MKVLSMYLPQFHRVKENDEWWGEGYTDWNSAQNAKPLYEGHYQPHIPYNQYYYDLMDKSALEWQASLMRKYGIDGQCIYHYWFKDGRQILEKPIERLLEWKDIDMPFCFDWANQSWAYSWCAVKDVNVWNENFENKKGNGTGLLLEQQYGDEKEWRQHFEYLLPFFRDKRYIRVDGKPVFVIHRPGEIAVLDKMTACWNIWAKEEGITGIYFIGTYDKNRSFVDAVLYPAPTVASAALLTNEAANDHPSVLDYEKVWEYLIRRAYRETDCMVGAFTGYDDTPRRGERGFVIDNASPEIFKESLTKLMAVNASHNQPFTFINAWNEWGEGMHLEPDEKNGYSYLEAVSYAKKHYQD